MAQGRQERLPQLTHPKQLLEVNGEPILKRTLRLVNERPHVGVTVVGPPALEPFLGSAWLTTLRDPGFCILDGLARTIPAVPQGVVLLGDVVFSRAAIELVWTHQPANQLFFFGTPTITSSTGEIFGFGWTSLEALRKIDRLLAEAPCRRIIVDRGQPGHLRNLLFSLERIYKREEIYLPVTDWTNDIDTPEDVRDLLPKLSAACAAEIV